MELLKGRDLHAGLREAPPLSLREKVSIVIQVLDGLGHAHKAGIVHRDIKPANVFLTEEGAARIMDFGIAFWTSSGGTSRTVLGTVAYMSPEQVRGERVDGRSDIFSVGTLLHEVLTGRRPFDAETPMATFYRISRGEPALDLPAGPEYQGLLPVLRRALALAVEERFPTASEFAAALRAWTQDGVTLEARTATAADQGGAREAGTGDSRRAGAACRSQSTPPVAPGDLRRGKVGPPPPRRRRRAQEPPDPAGPDRPRDQRHRRRAPRRRPRPLRPPQPGGPGPRPRHRSARAEAPGCRSGGAGPAREEPHRGGGRAPCARDPLQRHRPPRRHLRVRGTGGQPLGDGHRLPVLDGPADPGRDQEDPGPRAGADRAGRPGARSRSLLRSAAADPEDHAHSGRRVRPFPRRRELARARRHGARPPARGGRGAEPLQPAVHRHRGLSPGGHLGVARRRANAITQRDSGRSRRQAAGDASPPRSPRRRVHHRRLRLRRLQRPVPGPPPGRRESGRRGRHAASRRSGVSFSRRTPGSSATTSR